jgi:hypothetical protein
MYNAWSSRSFGVVDGVESVIIMEIAETELCTVCRSTSPAAGSRAVRTTAGRLQQNIKTRTNSNIIDTEGVALKLSESSVKRGLAMRQRYALIWGVGNEVLSGNKGVGFLSTATHALNREFRGMSLRVPAGDPGTIETAAADVACAFVPLDHRHSPCEFPLDRAEHAPPKQIPLPPDGFLSLRRCDRATAIANRSMVRPEWSHVRRR